MVYTGSLMAHRYDGAPAASQAWITWSYMLFGWSGLIWQLVLVLVLMLMLVLVLMLMLMLMLVLVPIQLRQRVLLKCD